MGTSRVAGGDGGDEKAPSVFTGPPVFPHRLTLCHQSRSAFGLRSKNSEPPFFCGSDFSPRSLFHFFFSAFDPLFTLSPPSPLTAQAPAPFAEVQGR